MARGSYVGKEARHPLPDAKMPPSPVDKEVQELAEAKIKSPREILGGRVKNLARLLDSFSNFSKTGDAKIFTIDSQKNTLPEPLKQTYAELKIAYGFRNILDFFRLLEGSITEYNKDQKHISFEPVADQLKQWEEAFQKQSAEMAARLSARTGQKTKEAKIAEPITVEKPAFPEMPPPLEQLTPKEATPVIPPAIVEVAPPIKSKKPKEQINITAAEMAEAEDLLKIKFPIKKYEALTPWQKDAVEGALSERQIKAIQTLQEHLNETNPAKAIALYEITRQLGITKNAGEAVTASVANAWGRRARQEIDTSVGSFDTGVRGSAKAMERGAGTSFARVEKPATREPATKETLATPQVKHEGTFKNFWRSLTGNYNGEKTKTNTAIFGNNPDDKKTGFLRGLLEKFTGNKEKTVDLEALAQEKTIKKHHDFITAEGKLSRNLDASTKIGGLTQTEQGFLENILNGQIETLNSTQEKEMGAISAKIGKYLEEKPGVLSDVLYKAFEAAAKQVNFLGGVSIPKPKGKQAIRKSLSEIK